jgi:endo-alpha-1,4-polygalactosaminidase (GH114 family)
MNRPKTNGSFNISKTTKRMMALMKFTNKTDWKFQMIDAELAEIKARSMKFVPKDNTPE